MTEAYISTEGSIAGLLRSHFSFELVRRVWLLLPAHPSVNSTPSHPAKPAAGAGGAADGAAGGDAEAEAQGLDAELIGELKISEPEICDVVCSL